MIDAHFIVYWLVSACAVLITSKIVPGFEVRSFVSAMIAAVGIGVLNALLWWLFFVVSFPLTVITLGLFVFVINGAILKISAALLPGFEIRSWFSAIFGSIVLSLVGVALHYLIV